MIISETKQDKLYRCYVTYEYDDISEVWVAHCINLPGASSQGHTKDEALANIHEAIRGIVESYIEDNIQPPWIEAVHISDGANIDLIQVKI